MVKWLLMTHHGTMWCAVIRSWMPLRCVAVGREYVTEKRRDVTIGVMEYQAMAW